MKIPLKNIIQRISKRRIFSKKKGSMILSAIDLDYFRSEQVFRFKRWARICPSCHKLSSDLVIGICDYCGKQQVYSQEEYENGRMNRY